MMRLKVDPAGEDAEGSEGLWGGDVRGDSEVGFDGGRSDLRSRTAGQAGVGSGA